MRHFPIFLFISIAIVALLLTPLARKLHDRLEASCNATGGSYLGGWCIPPKEDPVYTWCLNEVRTQHGKIAILPSRCGKYAQELFDNQ